MVICNTEILRLSIAFVSSLNASLSTKQLDFDGSLGSDPIGKKKEKVPCSNGLKVDDLFEFKKTPTTAGGKGVVIGFTNGNDPFCRIRRTTGRYGGFVVNRKPRLVDVLS